MKHRSVVVWSVRVALVRGAAIVVCAAGALGACSIEGLPNATDGSDSGGADGATQDHDAGSNVDSSSKPDVNTPDTGSGKETGSDTDGQAGTDSGPDSGSDTGADTGSDAADTGTDADPCAGLDLTQNNSNCGACGHSCLGGTCSNSKCGFVKVADAADTGQLVVTGGYVYFLEGWGTGVGSVKKVATTGGTVTPIATGLSWVNRITSDGTDLFITGYGSNPGTNGYVSRLAFGGGLTPMVTTLDYPNSISLDGTYAYFGTHGKDAWRVAKTATNASPISVYTGAAQSASISVAVSGAYLYFTNYDAGTVSRVPVGGGTVTPIATGQTNPYDLVCDGTKVYWQNAGATGSIMSAPVAGGVAPTPLATNQCAPSEIAMDASYIYWTNNCANGSVSKVSKQGGAIMPVATNQPNPSGLALDSTSVYWSTQTEIRRVAK